MDCAEQRLLHKRFQYFDCSIQVGGNDPLAIEWLDEFLSPAFEVDQVREDTPWQVTLTVQQSHFDELRREYERSPRQSFDVFTLDDHFTQSEGWLRSNRQRVLWDSQYRVFYVVSEDGRRTEMVAPHPTVRYRVALMRIVREMATVHCSRQGMLHMHASSLCSGTNGLLISGPKRSGKTSLLMYGMQSPRTALLANDRVFVAPAGDGWIVRGMPTIVRIRQSSLQHFPELARRLRSQTCHHNYSLAESFTARPAPTADEAPTLTGRQLITLIGGPLRTSAPLTSIVFPRINPEIATYQLKQLCSAEALSMLRRGFLSAGGPEQLSTVFTELGYASTDGVAQRQDHCLRLAESLSCIQCELGSQAYQDSSLMDCLLETAARPRRQAA